MEICASFVIIHKDVAQKIDYFVYLQYNKVQDIIVLSYCTEPIVPNLIYTTTHPHITKRHTRRAPFAFFLHDTQSSCI